MMCLRSQSDDGCIGSAVNWDKPGDASNMRHGISQSRQGQISGIMKLSAFPHRLRII
jgi:hypothetical protein